MTDGAPISDQQKALRAIIDEMSRKTGMSYSALAVAAGLAASTLTRFMNFPSRKLLSANTLARLQKASGVSVNLETLGAAGPAPEAAGRPVARSLPAGGGAEKVPLSGFGARVRAVRVARQMTTDAFARLIGVPAKTIEALEDERQDLDIEMLGRMRYRGDIPADWLLFGDAGALPARLVQIMVTMGSAAGAPEPARELRWALSEMPDSPGRTLHEDQQGIHRTILPVKRG